MKRRLNTLTALAGKSWGSDKEILGILNTLEEQLNMEWQLGAPQQQRGMYIRFKQYKMRQPESSQTVRNTRTECLNLEADLPLISKRIKEIKCKSCENSLTLPEDNSRNTVEIKSLKKQLKALSWRTKADIPSEKHGLNSYPREHLTPATNIAPWENIPKVTLENSFKMEKSDEEIKGTAKQTLKELPAAAIKMWTDGSVKDATEYGGGEVKVGVWFELSFLGPDSGRACTLTHTVSHDDVFWLTTSASVRWYALVFPDVVMIRGLQIHACSPLMFYGPAKPAKDGIIQKSLLLDIRKNMNEFFKTATLLGEDEHVQLFEVTPGVLLARYKVDNELAFIMCVLHYHNLVSRCLSGAVDRCWTSARRKAPQDDIDPHYGLHGYSCVIILRNTRQKILECKFSDLHTNKDSLVGDFAEFHPVRKHDKMSHITCLKDISFPWRTSLFKGIVQNVAILDMTLLDEGGEPFWTVTGMISFQTSAVQADQFEFSPESYRHACYEDKRGQIYLEIGKLDDGTSYLSSLDILLSLAVINKVFHTTYGKAVKPEKSKSAQTKLAMAAKDTEKQ
ncbi:F-box only protein 15 [Elysia marginata]|uniref:F-box only protein 15 n=1 Tax=Elysia marginata TaxID=1093978 RepID=A0AAV4HSI6_9GAST|nr:F-box only protein 15 [Elysia marginata]